MPKRITFAAAAFFALLAHQSPGVEAPPGFIDYQGQLLNSIGGPITGGGGPGTMGTAANFEIRFRIWNAQTGGALIWAEKHIVTVDENGFFSVRLGEGEIITVADGDPNPLAGSIPHSDLLNAFDQNERFLGVTVMQPPNTPGEISPRLRFLSSPYAVVAQKSRIAEAGPAGGIFSADQIGVGTSSPTTQFHVANTGSINLLVAADTDNVNENDQPSLTFSQDGGLTKTSLGYFDGSDDFAIESATGVRLLTIQPDGDVGVGTDSPSEDFHLIRPNSDEARFYATGTGTGGGMYYAGQDTNYGGGFFYEGDATPSVPGNPDRTVFFRRSNGTDVEVMSYAYNSNNVYFTGNVGLGTQSPADRLTIAGTGNIHLDDGSIELLAGDSQGIFWSYTGAFLSYMRMYHDSNNRFWAVNSSGGVYLNSGATSWTANSDERLKSEIEPVGGILDKIRDIRVVNYNLAQRKTDPVTNKTTIDRNTPPRITRSGKVIKHEIGTIAQDWVRDFPELVSEPADDSDFYGLSYDRIGVVAIGAAQELDRKFRAAEAKLEARDAKIADLETRLARLEALLSQPGHSLPPPRK